MTANSVLARMILLFGVSLVVTVITIGICRIGSFPLNVVIIASAICLLATVVIGFGAAARGGRVLCLSVAILQGVTLGILCAGSPVVMQIAVAAFTATLLATVILSNMTWTWTAKGAAFISLTSPTGHYDPNIPPTIPATEPLEPGWASEYVSQDGTLGPIDAIYLKTDSLPAPGTHPLAILPGKFRLRYRVPTIILLCLISYAGVILVSLAFRLCGDDLGFFAGIRNPNDVGAWVLDAAVFLVVILSVISVASDFESIHYGLSNQLPIAQSWQSAFFLSVTPVWLYANLVWNILRFIFQPHNYRGNHHYVDSGPFISILGKDQRNH